MTAALVVCIVLLALLLGFAVHPLFFALLLILLVLAV